MIIDDGNIDQNHFYISQLECDDGQDVIAKDISSWWLQWCNGDHYRKDCESCNILLGNGTGFGKNQRCKVMRALVMVR